MSEITNIRKFAKETMKKYYEEGKIKHFVVSWVSSTHFKEDLGKISYLTLCEHIINNEKDFNKWQMRIQITPKNRIFWVKNEKIRDFKDVFEEIMNDDIKSVALCIKLIKRYEINNKSVYLCKIFDAWGIYETYIIKPEGYHDWIAFFEDDKNESLRLFTKREEAEKIIMMKIVLENGCI